MKKTILCFGMVLMLCACGEKKQSDMKEETIRVTVEKAQFSSDYAEIPYVGEVEAESSTTVSFTGMATLKQLTVSEGQHVTKGQLLATIDETQSRNALAAAKAALDQALDAKERMKQLHENHSISDMQWVEVESKVQQAQASYDLCQKNLKECSLYAPVSGVVGSKMMSAGETVLPSGPVLTILNINRVKVRVSIPEKEIASIQGNTPTRISVEALGGETFAGGQIEKGVSADPLTHTYDVKIMLDNPGQKLLPGMVTNVRFVKGNDGEEVKVLTLPVKSIQQNTDKSLFVWVAKDGKAHRQTVTIGQAVGNRVAVVTGLSEGEQVIVEGYQKLGEGTPVAF